MARSVKQLNVVLEQRASVEQKMQRAVAALESQRLEIERRMSGVGDSLRAIRLELRDALTPTGDAGGATGSTVAAFGDIRLQAGATLHAQIHLQTLAIELAGAHQRLNRAREELRAASAARKAVKLLIDRRKAEAQRVADRRETVDLDEMSISRHGRADEDAVEASQ